SSIMVPAMRVRLHSSPSEIPGLTSTRSCARIVGTDCGGDDRKVANSAISMIAPAAAMTTKLLRHPHTPPIHVPIGTPSAIDPVTPRDTKATDRPTRFFGARAAADANIAGVAPAAPAAARARNTNNQPISGATAAAALAPMNAVKHSA